MVLLPGMLEMLDIWTLSNGPRLLIVYSSLIELKI
jgi:hypothetical protein